MSEHKIPQHGTFCWNELNTKNAAAARKFYTELLGWQLVESDSTSMPYTEIVVGGQHIGGMFEMTEACGASPDMPSHWMSYVAVDDVDAAAARVEGLGGKICVPPTDIPNVGRFTVITDPTGASISLIRLTGASS